MSDHPRAGILLFVKRSCDFNITTDNILVRQKACTEYYIDEIRVANASISLTTAVGGVYTASGKGGNALVANTQVYSALTGSGPGLILTLEPIGLGRQTAGTLYLNLTTAQGAAATADVFVFGTPTLG